MALPATRQSDESAPHFRYVKTGAGAISGGATRYPDQSAERFSRPVLTA
jgi:hypothetical protein